jgi:hypothetical protein
MAELVRWLIEHGVPMVLGAARPALQRHMTHRPAVLGRFSGRAADARHPRDLLRQMPVRPTFGLVGRE